MIKERVFSTVITLLTVGVLFYWFNPSVESPIIQRLKSQALKLE